MTELVIDGFPPALLVSANKKLHYRRAGEVRAHWRALAGAIARQTYGPTPTADHTWHTRVRIVITYRFPDLRRHDVGNLYSYVAKPIVDGLVDAHVIPDDDDHHVVGPDPRRDFTRGPHRITLTIEDLP